MGSKMGSSIVKNSFVITLTGMSLLTAIGGISAPALAVGSAPPSVKGIQQAPASSNVLNPSVVKNVSVDESSYDINNNGHLDLKETAGLKIDFAFPDAVKPGDYFTVGLQSPFKFALSSNGLSVRNSDGVVIATVYPEQDDPRTIRFTAAEGASNLADVVGSATIPFASAATPTGEKIPFTYNINGGEMKDSGILIAPQKGRAGASSAIIYPGGTNDGTVGVSVVAFGTPTGTALKDRPITITFKPNSDNWKFDAALKEKFDSGQLNIDATYSDDGTKINRKYVRVVSSAPDKVVVRVDNVDPLKPLRVQLPESAGLGINDGKDLRLIAVVEGDGVQRAGLELKTFSPQPVADAEGSGVLPPKAVDDAAEVFSGNTVDIKPMANDSAQQAGASLQNVKLFVNNRESNSFTVDGQGTFTVKDNSTISFTPVDGFFGDVTPVSYKVFDSQGKAAISNIRVKVKANAPQSKPDNGDGGFCDSVTVDPLANDTLGNKGDTWNGVDLLDAKGNPVKKLVTEKGTYVVNAENKIEFTPQDCAFGTMPPVKYRATDSNNQTTESTVTVTLAEPTKPQADADTKQGDNCDDTVVDVLANDTLGNKGDTWTKVELLDGNGKPVDRLETDKGVFTIKDNKIVFSPGESCAFGEIPSVDYRATDSHNNTADSTVKISTPERPQATVDEKDADNCDETSVDVLANDKLGNEGDTWTKVELLDKDGKPVDRLETDKGVFTVGEGNRVVFTPSNSCAFGELPSVNYRATDSNGNTADSTVKMRAPERPQATVDEKDADNCDATEIDVLANDTLGNEGDSWTKIELLDKDGKPVDRLETDKGVFTIKDNKVVFSPGESCAFGEIPEVSYRATDSHNNTADSTVKIKTPESPKAVEDEKNADNCDDTDVDVLANDTLGNEGDTWTKVELLDKSGKPVDRLETDKGVFTVKDNKIVFSPGDSCVFGEIPEVSYRATDSHSNTADSTVKLKTPESPKAVEDEKDADNCDETSADVLANDTLGNEGDSWAKVELLDKDGKPVDRLETDKGVFTIKDNKVVFTPSDSCAYGEIASVKYRATDSNGNSVDSTLTVKAPEKPEPVVTPTPSPEPTESPTEPAEPTPTPSPTNEPTPSPSADSTPSSEPSATSEPSPEKTEEPQKTATPSPSVSSPSEPSGKPSQKSESSATASQTPSSKPQATHSTRPAEPKKTRPSQPPSSAADDKSPTPQHVGTGEEASEDDSKESSNQRNLLTALVVSVLGALAFLGILWFGEGFYPRKKNDSTDNDDTTSAS